ncbi:WD repeat-containing protein 65, putative [Plasmodium ovale]|uniref:WD repeat-containing protein 65, putative n=1 Tax=Plasmodium ovale TaxID=36330 RepID=A0A1D3TMY9_PLAOA|nr:WD repeat-containing protein 65, putative [Plasmodium ovale]
MFAFEKKEETYLTKAIYAYGINKNVYNPFFLIDDNSVFYCIGVNGVVHFLSEKKQRFLLGAENSYGIICLGISNDKKLLALGEKSLNKPFISIFTNSYKLVKRLFLNISDNESKIMNITFSSKNKYLYCITNGSTKSLFICYDWIQEKLIFSKIFPASLFNENCEIYLNTQNSSYIALLSVSRVKHTDSNSKGDAATQNGAGTWDSDDKPNDFCTDEGTKRDVYLYQNVDRNLVDVKIKNKKLEKIDNRFSCCCWLNDGVLLLINKNNYLVFYDVRKEKLKIYNKHLSSDKIVKVMCLSRGFLLYDYEFIYIYEKSVDLTTNLSYSLKYYVRFNYSTLLKSYCVLSPNEQFLYFLTQDGNLKKFDLTKDKIQGENMYGVDYESLRNGGTSVMVKKEKWDNSASTANKLDEKSGEGATREELCAVKCNGEEGGITQLAGESAQQSDYSSRLSADDNLKEGEKNIETVINEISSAKINDFDVCLKYPLIIVCYDDNMIRIINYKKKEVIMSSSFNNEPLRLSIHCSGHLLLVAFTDKLRLYHILYNKLKVKKEIFLKNCSCCKFANGGNFMAVSKISTIYIYKTYSYDLLFVLKSHVNYITDIVWSLNDFSIFSIGKDGYLFEYALYNNGNKNIEVMQKEKKFLSIDLEYINEKNKKKENNNENNSMEKIKFENEHKSFNNHRSNEIKNIFISCDDKTIKQFCDAKIECIMETEYVMNKIVLYKNKFLISTFHNGFFCRIRFYVLPLCGLYLEIPCHVLNCVNLKFDVNKELLFSCSRDGSIYIFSLEKIDDCFLSPGSMITMGELPCVNVREQLPIQPSTYTPTHSENQSRAQSQLDGLDNGRVCDEDGKGKGDLFTGVYFNEEKRRAHGEAAKGETKLSLSDLKNTDTTLAVDSQAQASFPSTSPSTFPSPGLEGIEGNENDRGRVERMYPFLMYDLGNKTNYFLNEEEQKNEDILIDFYYVQKKNKEVLELQKKITNLRNEMILEMKNKESIYKNDMKKLKKEKDMEIQKLIKINKNIVKEKEKTENKCKESLYELEEKHTYFINQLNSQFYLTNKICEEKFLKLEEEFNTYKKNSTCEILHLQNEHQAKINQLVREKRDQLEKKEDYIKNTIIKYENIQREKDEYIKRLEEDVDEEILIITQKYQEEIDSLKNDKHDLLGKFKLYEYIESELKEGIQLEKDKFNVDILKLDVDNLKECIMTKEKEIESKNGDIANLNKRNDELEKLKIVLTQKIKDLESSLSPKESEIKMMREKIDEMAKCFENNHKKTVNLQIEINEYKMKIKSLHDDLTNYNKTIGNYEKILKNLQEHIKECYLHLHDKKIFNSSFLNLYNKFHKVNDVKNYDTKNVFSEYIRQKEHLENMIEVLKEKLEKETEAFRTEKIKMMSENSLLLKEINDLKMDLNFLKSECHDEKLKNRKIKFLKREKNAHLAAKKSGTLNQSCAASAEGIK